MLAAQLRENGVADQQVQVIAEESDAVLAALDMAVEGDLLVIFGDDIKRCWKQVAGYEVGESGRRKSETRTLVESFVEEDPEAFRLDADMELIRDERGVRIARLDEESD